MLGDERHRRTTGSCSPPCSRAPTGSTRSTLRDPGWYAGHGVDLRLGGRVARGGPGRREVVLADGGRGRLRPAGAGHRRHPDAAAGARAGAATAAARPRCTPSAASTTAGGCSARPGRPAAPSCVGGGLLGLQAARALAVRGLATEVVEGAEHLLARQVDPRGGAVLRPRPAPARHRGLHRRPRGPADRRRGATSVASTTAPRSTADLVVLTAGGRPVDRAGPAAGLVRAARRRRRRPAASVTDDRIHAIGDCAEHAGRGTGFVAAGLGAGRRAGRRASPASGGRYDGSRSVARLAPPASTSPSSATPSARRRPGRRGDQPGRRLHRKLVVRDGVHRRRHPGRRPVAGSA